MTNTDVDTNNQNNYVASQAHPFLSPAPHLAVFAGARPQSSILCK